MSSGWVQKTAAAMLFIAAWSAPPARAQFRPGWMFTVEYSSYYCKDYLDDEYVLGWDPEIESRWVFAEFDYCPGLRTLAMSPDGKHLRVAAYWGAILQFDSQGNWTTVLDGSDGVNTTGAMAYDRERNFYVANYTSAKVVRFPADGSPKQVLAYHDNNGVIVEAPNVLSVGPAGEVYAGDANRLIRIGEDGVVSVFDTFGPQARISSIVVDDFGYVHVKLGYWYRYELGDPSSRVLFDNCDGIGPEVCSSSTLALSPDRKRIYVRAYDYYRQSSHLLSFDPHDATFKKVMNSYWGGDGFVVVPLRGDVDGDRETDLVDLMHLAECVSGPRSELVPSCDLADMDADGDVDLFDVRYFELGYTAFAEP